jgi:tetratricopeptide (TPR) repeat protein
MARPSRTAAILIVLAALAAYGNSFGGVFVFEDEAAIVQNPHIRALWPPRDVLGAPPGSTVAGRPLAALTLALNYAAAPIEARDVLSLPPGRVTAELQGRYYDNLWGYHGVTLAIHVVAALLLLGVLRRTLERPVLPPHVRNAAPGLALAATIVWTVHPLLTGAVTYLAHRAEPLAGLFYFLTVYAAIRALDGPRWWTAVAVAACALGMGSKETVATAPIAVVAWDAMFAAGAGEGRPHGREAWRQRLPLYAGLAATWLVLAASLASAPHAPTNGDVVTSWRSVLTEVVAAVRFLCLAVVPRPLVLDYAWPAPDGIASVLPQIILLAALAGLTLPGFMRRRPASFAGVWLFLTYLPPAVLPPDTAAVPAEHRMYLPLAGLVAFATVGIWRVLAHAPRASRRALAWGLTVIVVATLTAATRARNEDYHSRERLWADTVEKQPRNARARAGYAAALFDAGDAAAAEAQAREALRLDPALASAHETLGAALCAQQRCSDGIAALEAAVRLEPATPERLLTLGDAYAALGNRRQALDAYERALALEPDDVLLLDRVAWILAAAPEASLRDGARAVDVAKQAVLLTLRRHVDSLDALAAAYAESGRFTEAVGTAEEALRLARVDEPERVASVETRLDGYREGRAFRQSAP